MRVVILGATNLTAAATELLLARGHEVIMIERDKERIDELRDTLDCAFIHGSGTRPAILKEAGPKESDVLLCLTDEDEDNILAALVGRSLGFDRVVPKIEEADLQHVCLELGLSDTIIPSQTFARTLADLVGRQDILEMSTMIRGEVRFFSFVVESDEDAGPVDDLGLPDRTRAVCIYRGDDFLLPDRDTRLEADDEVVLITHSDNLPDLRERWSGRPNG